MEITNQTTKHRCVMSFKQGGWFSGGNDLHAVEGFIVDRNKKKLKFLYGRWTEFLCAVDIASLEDYIGAKVRLPNSSRYRALYPLYRDREYMNLCS